MQESESQILTARDLFLFPLFEGESAETVEWIASQMRVLSLDAGETLVHEGDPVTEFLVVLEGEIHFARQGDPSAAVMVTTTGSAIGVLPFSRIRTSLGRAWAAQPTRLAAMDPTHLREVVYRAPLLAQRLVSQMTDRTRESTRIAESSNRLLALGKLAAGLAHELNNPASAAVRSSARLREVLSERRKNSMAWRAEQIPAEGLAQMTKLADGVAESTVPAGPIDELERADKEASLSDWLEGNGLPGELASALVDSAVSAEQIAPLLVHAPVKAVALGLRILVSDYEVRCLTQELEEASRRISDLVQSVKSYSYMDQSPQAEIEVAQGLELTLRMFQHQLKHGVRVTRDMASNVPRIRADGSALNQIWTNLIDNALDAMNTLPPNQPKVLSIRTCVEPSHLLVEIGDNGPGIPPSVQSRIFDPFFTTKPVGEGTGLGLDIVHRIVRNHKGSIRVDSQPGRTVFQVRLPI